MKPVTVSQMYEVWDVTKSEVRAELSRSLTPRPSSSLFDVVEAVGPPRDATVLDIGARDARHSVTLHERFGWHVVAVDPLAGNIKTAQEFVRTSGHGDTIEVRQGSIEAIPSADERFELVFCRDVISHVRNIASAFSESERVTRPGGTMIVYQTFATDLLEPEEKARICSDLAVNPGSLERARFETEALAAGFEIKKVDVIGSE